MENLKLKCVLCNHQEFIQLYQINSWPIVECQNCHLIFAPLEMDENQQTRLFNRMYTEQYFKAPANEKSPNKPGYQRDYFLEKEPEQRINAQRRLKRIERLVPEKGRILDIGCAAGFFLDVAQEHGWQPIGLELSQSAANFARQQFGIEVITGFFEEQDFPENHFQAITAWDVIEHVRNPGDFVKKAFRILAPSGLLVLGTPNVGSLAYKVRRAKWPILKPPEHLFYFQPSTLERLLSRKFGWVQVLAGFPPHFRTKPTVVAHLRKVLYHGFNTIAQLVGQGEYLIGYARKI